MRIVNRSEFLKLPAGILFYNMTDGKSEFGETSYCIGGSLNVKGKTIDDICNGNPIDFYHQDLTTIDAHNSDELFDKLFLMSKGQSFVMNDAEQRYGLFDEDDLFMIYEFEDLSRLGKIVKNASRPTFTLLGNNL